MRETSKRTSPGSMPLVRKLSRWRCTASCPSADCSEHALGDGDVPHVLRRAARHHAGGWPENLDVDQIVRVGFACVPRDVEAARVARDDDVAHVLGRGDVHDEAVTRSGPAAGAELDDRRGRRPPWRGLCRRRPRRDPSDPASERGKSSVLRPWRSSRLTRPHVEQVDGARLLHERLVRIRCARSYGRQVLRDACDMERRSVDAALAHANEASDDRVGVGVSPANSHRRRARPRRRPSPARRFPRRARPRTARPSTRCTPSPRNQSRAIPRPAARSRARQRASGA